MGPEFNPIQSVEAWQLSNPPIFQLASMRASMNLFDKIGIDSLRDRGDKITSYLEFLFRENWKRCDRNDTLLFTAHTAVLR